MTRADRLAPAPRFFATEPAGPGHRLCVTHTRARALAIAVGAALGTWLLSGLAGCNGEPPPAEDLTGALEGDLSSVSVLGSDGRGSQLYFLDVPGRAAPLQLSFETDPNLPSRTPLRIWGAPGDDGLFHVTRQTVVEDLAADGTKRSELIGQPSTSHTVAWVQMDVNGGGVNQTAAAAQALIFGQGTGPLFGTKTGNKSLVQYYDENSYGMLQLTGQVEGPIPFSGTACNNFDPLAQNVIAQVTALGRTYDHYYLYWGSEQPCGPGWGEQGTRAKPGKSVWLNNDGTFCTATGQELGHNFGMMHASTMVCPSATIANDTTTCTSNEYGNPMTVMGGGCGHLNAIEKWYDGYLLGCNAVKVKTTTTFTLLPIEIPCNGIQALQIAMPAAAPVRTTTTDQSNGPVTIGYYYLELRGGQGMDTGMKTGVYVHAAADIPTPTSNGARTFLLDMNPATTAFDPMSVGQTFTDPAGGVSFTLNTVSTTAASVTVSLTGGSANLCADGTTLAGGGPTTCGSGGTGGAGGTGGSGAAVAAVRWLGRRRRAAVSREAAVAWAVAAARHPEPRYGAGGTGAGGTGVTGLAGTAGGGTTGTAGTTGAADLAGSHNGAAGRDGVWRLGANRGSAGIQRARWHLGCGGHDRRRGQHRDDGRGWYEGRHRHRRLVVGYGRKQRGGRLGRRHLGRRERGLDLGLLLRGRAGRRGRRLGARVDAVPPRRRRGGGAAPQTETVSAADVVAVSLAPWRRVLPTTTSVAFSTRASMTSRSRPRSRTRRSSPIGWAAASCSSAKICSRSSASSCAAPTTRWSTCRPPRSSAA